MTRDVNDLRYQTVIETVLSLKANKTEIRRRFNKVTQDSRKVERDDVYVAIQGERFDGNQFIEEAYERGASLIICSKRLDPLIPHIYYYDTVKFIQEWARRYRESHTAKIIGITGSNGKTTTKELIYNVLSDSYKCYRTPGNYNNHIGVPLTLLNMPGDIEYAVVEMGTNHVGEIPFLAELVKPTHSIVTNIGYSHMQNFKSVRELSEEKCSLFLHTSKDGHVFINKDDTHIRHSHPNPITYSVVKSSENQIKNIRFKQGFMVGSCNGKEIETHLLGKHLLHAVIVAFTIGKTVGIPLDKISERIKSFSGVEGRMEWIEKNNISYINDSYNANPTSTKAALKFLLDTNFGKKKIAVLGDMLELGDAEEFKHEEILSFIEEKDVDVMLFGDIFGKVNRNRFFHAEIYSEIREKLASIEGEKVVLLKGSRGMKLEKIMEHE